MRMTLQGWTARKSGPILRARARPRSPSRSKSRPGRWPGSASRRRRAAAWSSATNSWRSWATRRTSSKAWSDRRSRSCSMRPGASRQAFPTADRRHHRAAAGATVTLALPDRLAMLEWWYDDPDYLAHRGYDEVVHPGRVAERRHPDRGLAQRAGLRGRVAQDDARHGQPGHDHHADDARLGGRRWRCWWPASASPTR